MLKWMFYVVCYKTHAASRWISAPHFPRCFRFFQLRRKHGWFRIWFSDSCRRRFVRKRERERKRQTGEGRGETDGQTGQGLLRVCAAQNSAADRQHRACPGEPPSLLLNEVFEPVSQHKFPLLGLSTDESNRVLTWWSIISQSTIMTDLKKELNFSWRSRPTEG